VPESCLRGKQTDEGVLNASETASRLLALVVTSYQITVLIRCAVWLCNGTLYIGYEQGALCTARTFEHLYINPILDTMNRQNPKNSSFLTSPTNNGVFEASGRQTLYLVVMLGIFDPHFSESTSLESIIRGETRASTKRVVPKHHLLKGSPILRTPRKIY
jgi:hypothetical protein